jgi:hypothetical protein
MRLFFICLFLIGGHFSYSQTNATADSVAVDKACKDYVEGFYTGDTNRIRQAMHPELCKRILAKQRNYAIYTSTVADLINASKGKKQADPDPSQPFAIKVEIYDIAYGIAAARIATNKMSFIDYAQLAKVNGEWKVVNVLWAFTR